MSYDIAFIKTKNLNIDNVYDLLEATEPSPEHEIYIDNDLMNKLILDIKNIGIKFEIFEGKNRDHFELNFPTYSVSIFRSEVAISVPYWDENSDTDVNLEIKRITNILLENGFTGFDSQTGEFITEPYSFQSTFTESKSIVDTHFKNSSATNNNYIKYFGFLIGVIVVGYLIWRYLIK